MNQPIPRMAVPVRRAAPSRKLTLLRTVLLIAGIGPLFVALGDTSEIPTFTRALGVITWFLCTLPSLLYLKRRHGVRRPLPFIEAISFIYGLYYALPIALGQTNKAWRITVDPREGYDVPMQLVFFGWIAMMGAYLIAAHILKKNKPPRDIPWRPDSVMKWGSVFLLGGVTVNAARTIIGGSASVGGVIQLFVALQWLGLGLLTVLARRRELSSVGKIVLIVGFLAAVAVALAQGNISPVVLLCVVIGFALWAGRPVIEARWIVAGAFAILIAVSLRGVIRDFRMTAWLGTEQFTQMERIQLMGRLLQTRIENEGVFATLAGGGAQTAQRSANMDVFADVIRRTPSEVPYWKGQTYYSLVGAAIPRFMWPNKPTKELGQAFGHRYRYLDPTNKSTAINLPILVEFFANFGATAVIIGMFIVGVIYGALDTIVNRPGQSQLVSMIAVTLLLPLLLIESDFSLVFGGLPLSGLALWGIYVLLKRSALGRVDRRIQPRARMTSLTPREQVSAPRNPALPAG